MPTETSPVVHADNLCKYYGRADAEVRALDHVTLCVSPMERIALVGRSGSGKTTLLNLLAGLDRPTAGTLRVAEQDLSQMTSRQLAQYRRRDIGVVFQSFQLLPHCSAWQNVAVPLMLQGLPRGERKRRAEQALTRVGLAHRLHHVPGELSGGEQQRVAVARALVHRPQLVLADEPTGNLDSRSATAVMDLMLEVVEEAKAAMILITHDIELAARYGTRPVHLADGRVEVAHA